jgi:hypothetical protein
MSVYATEREGDEFVGGEIGLKEVADATRSESIAAIAPRIEPPVAEIEAKCVLLRYLSQNSLS